MPGSRPSSPCLIWSQFFRTSPAVSAETSPKTCGWRRISFWRQCSATAAKSPWPRSSSRIERKTTWNRTSPSSSSSFRSSPRLAASASSYASSTVCGTIERSSCSRSHGHSTRSRRLISSRRASARPDSSGVLIEARLRARLRRRGRAALRRLRRALLRCLRCALRCLRCALRCLRCALRHLLRRPTARLRAAAVERLGGRLGLRRVLALVDDVALGAVRLRLVVLLELGDEVVERLLLRLRLEQVLDRVVHLGQRLLLGRLHVRDLEDV